MLSFASSTPALILADPGEIFGLYCGSDGRLIISTGPHLCIRHEVWTGSLVGSTNPESTNNGAIYAGSAVGTVRSLEQFIQFKSRKLGMDGQCIS